MTARFLCLLAILTYVTTGPKGGEGFQDTVSHVSAACLMSEALHGVPNSVKVFKTSAAANVSDASKAREGCQDAVRRAEDASWNNPKAEEAVGRARAALKEAESAENAAKTALSDVEQYAANAPLLAAGKTAPIDDYLKSVAEDNSAASTARRIARGCSLPNRGVNSWVLTQAVESACAIFMGEICRIARTRMVDLRAEYDQLEAAVRRASEARVAARAAESNARKAAEEAERTAETEEAKVQEISREEFEGNVEVPEDKEKTERTEVEEVPKKDPEGKVEISDDDHVQELGDDEGEEAEVGNDGSYAESIGGYTLLILLAALFHSAAAHFKSCQLFP
ncbi:hypothetical protein, conserved [Trypanosoma brucei gambiense DAL972]|uniref:Trypanosoma glutamic acid/alanine-rich protein domain-containing protein n=1 Tax=Trypanosoma brucei gambiense (strain MHOM/CI/86/DAL972) TaxID=679716 RepID=C9ZRR3_TRYB9|nr:hypothetical protein, conserved [Trypanosoma brucei gambiense DAL972]CBH12049.1 hypothetical protein, conserved [Trypanosoma brucei gambiense DAL972]|eukprot:XP_011774332.1 hypothetical protein, conserved [Trypanosoma brucei gambiense DAL972]